MITVILAVLAIGACGRFSFEKKYGFCDQGFRTRFHHKDLSDHILKKLDLKVSELDLNPSQQLHYDAIRQNIKADLGQMQANRKKFVADMRAELERDRPELQVLADLVKMQAVKMSKRVDKSLDDFIELYDILDHKQKTRVITEMRKKLKRFFFIKEQPMQKATR